MSDHAEVLVCLSFEPPQTVAPRVLERLVEAGIVSAIPTDCTLGSSGYAPGPNVKAAVRDTSFTNLRVNGLEIELPDQVELFGWGEGFEPSFACSSCKRALDEGPMYGLLKAGVSAWGRVACPACEGARPLWEWNVLEGALGNLGFHFWNWTPLRKSFIERMEDWCEAPLTRVHVAI
ncbi:MAG: hypothetical protein HOW73_26865 [Polyangiaceae bacterium]|nr:hypothetical protein [Polyangiaceae bacterium]